MPAPTPVSESAEVQQHYLTQAALATAVSGSVASLWSSLDPMASPTDLARFADALFAVSTQYAPASASLAGDYYRNVRREAGITQTLTLPPVQPLARPQIDAGVEWAMREREESKATVADMQAAILADMQAATEKAVLDAGRDLVVQAVEGDENALGFRRVARPGACYWCLSQAIRSTTRRGLATDWDGKGRDPKLSAPGADGERHYGVFKSRKSAGQLPAAAKEVNRFHYRCRCTVEPVFAATEGIPAWLQDIETLYADSTVDSEKGQQLNDFRRALRKHRAGEETPTPAPAPAVIAPAKPDQRLVDLVDALNAAMAA